MRRDGCLIVNEWRVYKYIGVSTVFVYIRKLKERL